MRERWQRLAQQHRLMISVVVIITLLSCAGSVQSTPPPPSMDTPGASPFPIVGSIPASPPAATSTPASALAASPTPFLEVTENTSSPNSAPRGEIKVEYPLRMSPGSSDSVYVSIHIPAEIASLQPVEIGRVEIPPDAPPIIGKINSYRATILVNQAMRVELSSPTFEKIESLYPPRQPVNLKAVAQPTFWGWTVVAPNTPGDHVLTVKVYRGDNSQPSWLRSLQVEVVALTPPAVPFIRTSGGIVALGGGVVIILTLIVVMGFVVVRKRSAKNIQGVQASDDDIQTSDQHTLKTLNENLAHLLERAALHGMDVPLELNNEIEVTRQQITEIEAKLAPQEGKRPTSRATRPSKK